MIAPLVEGRSLRFLDHEITWAGECPWTGGFCFGTEAGELLICRGDGENALDVLSIKVSEEAINGVAFWRDLIGVSTRGEVNIARRSPSVDAVVNLLTAPGGAHGILATPGGRFFAPMGAAGLLRIDPNRLPGKEAVSIDRPDQSILNIYKLITLEDGPSRDLLAGAARTSGLLVIGSDGDKPLEIMGLVSPGVDFIDVCSISSSKWPHAVVGLSLDRSLIFVRDLSANESPQVLRLGELRGTPYSILSAEGHLFVLTSKELVDFSSLLPWYLDGEAVDRPFRYRYTPIQAVDAYIAHGKHLMIVMDHEVRVFEIPALIQPMAGLAVENGHDEAMEWSEGEQRSDLVPLNCTSLRLSA